MGKLPERLLRIPLATRTFPAWTCYGLATLIVLSALALRTVTSDSSDAFVFTFFFPAIIATGIFFGRGTALYATLLSTALTVLFVLPRLTTPLMVEFDLVALAAFAASGTAIAVIIELMHDEYLALSEARRQLLAQAETRTLLLREIAHRTRNDLGVISTVLSLQAMTLGGPAAKKALSAAAERLQIMSRIQARLDVQMQAVVVNSKEYLAELCDDLRLSLLSDLPVELVVQTESHALPHERAVALGLIANELLTNAIKYGFPKGRRGRISVQFKRTDHSYYLIVKDDGVGMAASDGSGSGLGLTLAKTITRQMGGSLNILPADTGTHIMVTLPA